ncbi:CoA binding domain-containing protein [Elsinoe ampelina]|uniref:CoA binding domain-containing protein n=1 Tax=Elsinoe ampelina TaxID=302913 RepID=A0A6A6GKK8_9PEZI|nr:CoA binding domain-containing protein [Elsinoe ampelina]
MSSEEEMEKAAKVFFASSKFAVAGASSDPRKFGNKIFAWYLAHGITPTPLNPTTSSVDVRNKSFETKASPSALSDPKNTSLSVITPPSVTSKLLKEAKEVGIRSVWLQPGSFDSEVLALAKKEFPGAAVGGDGGGGSEGWCILVDGEWAMKEAGRKEGRL